MFYRSILLSYFIKGHLVTISTISFSIINTGFRGEKVFLIKVQKRNLQCSLVAKFFDNPIRLDYFCKRPPSVLSSDQQFQTGRF